MCLSQFSSAELLTHVCDSDLTNDISSSLTAPFVVLEPSTSPLKKDISEKSEFFCSTCNIALLSQANYDAHVRGRKHISKERKSLSMKEQV